MSPKTTVLITSALRWWSSSFEDLCLLNNLSAVGKHFKFHFVCLEDDFVTGFFFGLFSYAFHCMILIWPRGGEGPVVKEAKLIS